MFTVTNAIIAVTAITSFIAFSNEKVMNDLIFYPPAISERKQWYRFITCGFIHADIPHLLFNMYSFYMFGTPIENGFIDLFGNSGKFLFLLLYISSLAACLLPTYFKHKHNDAYASLGASGAVSAVVFAFVFLSPLSNLRLFFIPQDIPAFIFGIIYLGISAYLAKRGNSHINHSAHFWGAVYGIVFLIVACYFMSDYTPVQSFWRQVTHKIF
jgi:membrane associated rhomboid family serine protease